MKFTFSPESRPLDGFTIKRAIHRGGFGEVYYALSDAGREVALKLLQNNAEVELRGVQQCLNLSHPNLVTIFDVRQDADEDYWIVMEYVSGETLDQVLRKHPRGMPVELIRRWFSGIVAGVNFLHERAIVHRDLKPGNVFSDGDVVKVGDIGLSKFITQSRRSAHTQSVGTVYYMAPEVAKGRYGKEVDVYALGIILYEMLTGQVPFDGESTGEILLKHLSETPDLGRLPPRLRPVVGKALAKDPALRFDSLKAFEAAFTDAVLGKTPLPQDLPETNTARRQDRQPQETAHSERLNGHHAEDEEARARTKNFLTIVSIIAVVILLGPRLGMWGMLEVAIILGVGTAFYRNRHLWFDGRERSEKRKFEPKPFKAPPLPSAPLFQQKRKGPTVVEMLSRWSGAAFLAVPVTALLTAGLAFLEPSLFRNLGRQQELDPGSVALFGIVSLLGVWGAMALPMLARMVGYIGTGHLRMHGLLLGLAVGLTAASVDSFLLVDLAGAVRQQDVVVRNIGDRPLWVDGSGPTLLGYCVYFMLLFSFRNWTGLASVERRKRFSIWSTVFTVGVAYVISHVVSFPVELAMAWGAIMACVVQISSPWTGVVSRSRMYPR